jgi:hypothetical protein
VRDHDQRALVADEELAQPVDRVEVEVVGRLVEQQRLRVAEQRLRQQHADLLAALQLAIVRSCSASGCRGPAAGSPRRSRRCSRPLRRRCPRARRGACRRRRSCRLRVERSRSSSALHSRWLPMITVSMTRKLVEGELILPQDAELLRARRRARCGGSSPVSSFMNVDLPAPFGPVRP